MGWWSVIFAILAGFAVGTPFISGSSPATIVPSILSAPAGGSGCTVPPSGGWNIVVPPARTGATMAYDSTDGYALMFGGLPPDASSAIGDTWEYKSGCWTQVCLTCSTSASGTTVWFNYTGDVQLWSVPAGVSSVSVDMAGAAGEPGTCSACTMDGFTATVGAGADGGRVQITSLSVTAGNVLDIYVGGMTATAGSSAYPGGGVGGTCNYSGGGTVEGGNGGGYSEIAVDGGSTLAVAGGGGGGASATKQGDAAGHGGAGATASTGVGVAGTAGVDTKPGGGGGGATASAGGAAGSGGGTAGTAGTSLQGGTGGESATDCTNAYASGGGGGGGYYGGGGGGSGEYAGGGGGGGDSDALSGTGLTYSAFETGNGYVKITYSSGNLEPPARFDGSMAWYQGLDEFVLFGGCTTADYISTSGYTYLDDCAAGSDILGDTWVWSGASGGWTEVCATGSCGITDQHSDTAIFGAAMAGDPNNAQCESDSNGCVLMYGGADATTLSTSNGACGGGNCIDQLWYFHGASAPGAWTSIGTNQINGGAGFAFPELVYVPSIAQVLLFGGEYDSSGHEAWDCDYSLWESTDTWSSRFVPTCGNSNEPVAVSYGLAVYDALSASETAKVVFMNGCQAHICNEASTAGEWGNYCIWTPAAGAAGTWSGCSGSSDINSYPAFGPVGFYSPGQQLVLQFGGYDSAVNVADDLGMVSFN